MSAVDDLTELVERAGAAERAALAARWKERADVEALRRRVQRAVEDQHALERLSTGPAPSGARARHLAAFLADTDGSAPAAPAATRRRSPVPADRRIRGASGLPSPPATPPVPRPTPWPR
jgi:hypothetical protein